MRFIRAFVETDNAETAARIAYPNCRNASAKGSALRSHPVVSQEIERARAATVVALGYGRAEVLRELTRIADFDPKNLVDDKGRPRRISDLDEDTRRGLVDHEVVITSDGTVKMVGARTAKVEALKVLAKINGMLDKQKQGPATQYVFDIHFHGKEEKPKKGKRGRLIEHNKAGRHVVGKDEEAE